jgi:hypothetical protein
MHSRGGSIVIIDVSLGNLPHTKKKDKMEKTSMRFIKKNFVVCSSTIYSMVSPRESLSPL